jgi:hypothetical protein
LPLPRPRSSIAVALDGLDRAGGPIADLRGYLHHLAWPLPLDLAGDVLDLAAYLDDLAADARAIAARIDEYDPDD